MRWNRWFGIIVAVLSMGLLFISFWPVAQISTQIPFSIPDGLTGKLELTQADLMHLGDKSSIHLKINFDPLENEEKQILIVSHLEMDQMSVAPRGEGQVIIDAAKPVDLQWQLNANIAGRFSGTLWLFNETSDGKRALILARPINVENKSLLGFSFKSARLISICGLIFSVIIFLVKFNRNKFR